MPGAVLIGDAAPPIKSAGKAGWEHCAGRMSPFEPRLFVIYNATMLLPDITPVPTEEQTRPNQFYLAEQLPLAELEQNVQNAAHAFEDNLHPERNALRLAWAHVELGLSTEITDTYATENFRRATQKLNILHHEQPEYQHDVQLIDGHVLRAYLPSFRARRTGEVFDAKHQRRLRLNLGYALKEVGKLENTKTTDAAIRRIGLLAAHARYQRTSHSIDPNAAAFLFPASARERTPWCSDDQVFANHHCYLVDDGFKVPLRDTIRTGGDPEVKNIWLSRLASSALARYGVESDIDLPDAVQHTTNIMKAELLGESIAVPEKAALDSITAEVIQTSLRHALRLRRNL